MPRPTAVLIALSVVSVASPAWALPRAGSCQVQAADLHAKTLAGLHIDHVTRRGGNWMRYSGRYRDTYFVVESGACERYVRQLIVISPEGTDPWSRLESLRRLFSLPPAPLDVEQRAELQRNGQLTLIHERVQMTYGYKAVGIVSVISLGFAERP